MILNIALDLILISIFIFGLRYGYKKGLFRMTAGPAKRILCLIISFSYSSIIANGETNNLFLQIIDNSGFLIPSFLVKPLTYLIAFVLLFIFSKIMLSFVIALIDDILDEGIFGILNSGLGMAFAGLISIGLMICLSTLIKYLLSNGHFDNFRIFDDFNGGPIYRFLIKLNPIGYIDINFNLSHLRRNGK